MIIKPNDIRKVRPIAENLNDMQRISMYIQEAENLRLIDAIGAKLYQFLDETDFTEDGPWEFNGITVTKDMYNEIIEGGYYEGGPCCSSGRSMGILWATAYFAYARFIMANPINATAFGVVVKNGEFSSAATAEQITLASNTARKTGEAFLRRVIEHLTSLGLIKCTKYVQAPKRILRVGKRKL